MEVKTAEVKCMELMGLRVWFLLSGKDNYIYILESAPPPKSNPTGRAQIIVVDPGDGALVDEFLEQKSLGLDEIWITHHHCDHIGGVSLLRKKYGAQVRGSGQFPGRVPELTLPTESHGAWWYSNFKVSVLELPGHTLDHIGYHLQKGHESLLFSGDVIFGFGCGRIFEGDYRMMLESLKKISTLDPQTLIFCAHEYTEANLAFTQREFEKNHWNDRDQRLQNRALKVKQLRERGEPTVPLWLDEELKTNLFLKCLNQEEPMKEFQRLRESRNSF